MIHLFLWLNMNSDNSIYFRILYPLQIVERKKSNECSLVFNESPVKYNAFQDSSGHIVYVLSIHFGLMIWKEENNLRIRWREWWSCINYVRVCGWRREWGCFILPLPYLAVHNASCWAVNRWQWQSNERVSRGLCLYSKQPMLTIHPCQTIRQYTVGVRDIDFAHVYGS